MDIISLSQIIENCYRHLSPFLHLFVSSPMQFYQMVAFELYNCELCTLHFCILYMSMWFCMHTTYLVMDRSCQKIAIDRSWWIYVATDLHS